MNLKKLSLLRASLTEWQRCLIIGVLISITSQLYLSAWAEGFRVSAAGILYPILLLTLMQDTRRPTAGAVTGLCVILTRVLLELLSGGAFLPSLLREYPSGVFYLCYDVVLCLLVEDKRSTRLHQLWPNLFLCDLLCNTLNLALSSHFDLTISSFLALAGVALLRSYLAAIVLWSERSYRRLLLREEHEERYRRLFLMTASLKNELYFLKKDAEDIENIMSHAYQLYESLKQQDVPEELRSLALSISRDIHEVKKDNLRIIRGLESEVADVYDRESMALRDLLSILESSSLQLLGEQRGQIRLICSGPANVTIREHYRLLSVLKNLVANAVEAIQSDSGRGEIRVTAQITGDCLRLTVSDNGPGIKPRAMKLLFEVGYSTKFNPETGNINRGMGLPAISHIVEELEGSIQVYSQPGQGASFQVTLPLKNVTGGSHEDLHH